jgi:hypothetical protein
MLFRETAAVYCENHTNTQIHAVGRIYSNAVRTSQETLRLRYRAQPVNAV